MSGNLIEVGAVVDLGQYKAGMQDAVATTEATTRQMSASFERHSAVSHEAVAGVKLGFEDAGIALNRHVARWLAAVPLLGAAAGVIFPAFAIFSFAESIGKFIGKSDEATAKLVEQGHASIEAADAIRQHYEQLEIDNLKIDDQIAVLNKLPAQNGVAIAAIEAKRKIDELLDSLSKAIVSQSNLFKAQIDSAFMSAIGRGTGEASVMASHFFQGLQQMRQYYDDWHRYENLGDTDNAEKFKHLFEQKEQGLKDFAKEAIQTLKDIESAPAPVLKKSEASPDAERAKAQQAALTDAYQKQKEAAAQLLPIVETLYGTFLQGEAEAKAAVQNGAGKQVVAAIEQAVKNYDLLKTHSEQSLKGQIEDLNSAKAAAIESFTAQGATMEEAKAKADAIYGPQILQARLDFFDRLGKAAVTQAEKDRLAGEAHIAAAQAMQRADEALAASQARFHVELAQESKEEIAQYDAAANKFNEIAAKRNKDLLQQFALAESLGDKRIATIDKEIVALNKLIASGRLNGDTTAAAYGRIHQLEQQRKKDLADDMIASGKLGQVMHGTMQLMILDGQQWQAKVGNTFKQTIDGMNASLSSFIVTGQGNWKQLAAGAIQSIIEIGLQYAESKALMAIMDKLGVKSQLETAAAANAAIALSEAFVAAATAYAPLAWDPPAAAEAATEAYGVVAGFSLGAGAVAGFDIGTNYVPMDGLAMLHKGEQVIPASKQGPGYSGGGDVHFHYSPIIQAMDDSGVDAVLTRHRKKFTDHFFKEAKKKGFGS
jgi:hypothetical protein